MKILVTAFDPFGQEPINSSLETMKGLPDVIAGAQIIKLQIPTVCCKSLQTIEQAIAEYDPDVILSLGQAGGRAEITVERVGINVDDYSIPDNEGNQITDQPICAEGPDAYFVTLPIRDMVRRVQSKGIPASISNSAGTFVCNHVTYGVCHLIAAEYPGKKSGFIHIPYLPGQTLFKRNVPSMSLDMIIDGVTAAIEAIVDSQ